MAAKMSDELTKLLERVGKIEPQQTIPVIVTVTPGANLTMLEQKGLKIQRIFEHISALSGTLTAAQANELAQLDQVENIEYDGEMRAI